MKTVITYNVITRGPGNPIADGVFRITVDPTSKTETYVREKRSPNGTWMRTYQADTRGDAMVFEALTSGTPPVAVMGGVRQLHLGDLLIG